MKCLSGCAGVNLAPNMTFVPIRGMLLYKLFISASIFLASQALSRSDSPRAVLSNIQAGRALTPRPGREMPAAERMLGADGLATLKTAIDRHKCVAAAATMRADRFACSAESIAELLTY